MIKYALDYYSVQSRETSRKRFKDDRHWDRLRKRDNRIEPPTQERLKELNILEEVQEQLAKRISYDDIG